MNLHIVKNGKGRKNSGKNAILENLIKSMDVRYLRNGTRNGRYRVMIGIGQRRRTF